jgi:hypothetical protein
MFEDSKREGGSVRHLIVVIAVLAAATGCGLNDPDTRRIIGIIDANPSTATIQAPDTVQLGAAFTATVTTLGSGCTTADGVKLTLQPAEARVIPFDRIPADDDAVCAAILQPLQHPVELRFTAPGTATIVAEGRVYGTTFDPVRGTVTKAVVVVP